MTAALKTPPARRPAEPSAFGWSRRVTTAWGRAAHVEAGLTWEDYCRVELAALRAAGPGLEIPTRRLLVKAMRLARMSEAAIASALGVSKSTVHTDRIANGDTDEPARVISVDGSDRPANTGRRPTAEVETELPLEPELRMAHTDRAVYLVDAYMPRGLTVAELMALTDWHHGNASGTLSRVDRQQRLRRDGRLRLGLAVYVLGPVELAKKAAGQPPT